jgi:tetratricopeptide (TPR) repeat protein
LTIQTVALPAAGVSEHIKQIPPGLLREIDTLPPATERPDLGPWLRQLEAVGLAEVEREGPEDENLEYSCDKLVRERIRLWMEERPADRGEFRANAVLLAYAERLERIFLQFRHKNMTMALEAGARAIVYLGQAGAYDRLTGFASGVVTGTRDPRWLERLIPHLEAAASSAPEGRARWSCLGYLADAKRRLGQPDKSLSFYEQAAALASTVAEAGGDGSVRAWGDFAWITGNWAIALFETGNLASARHQQMAGAEAQSKGERPQVPSPRLFAGRGRVRGLGDYPQRRSQECDKAAKKMWDPFSRESGNPEPQHVRPTLDARFRAWALK